MALKALLDGNLIYAFNIESPEEWETLRGKAVVTHCCQAPATLKTSKFGVRFFAHRRKGECDSAPETSEHLYLKYQTALVAKNLGWKVYTEKAGFTPDGEEWIADVFCEKGQAKLVFEIQWSNQSLEEFKRRQDKYKRSGIRAAWLYRLNPNNAFWACRNLGSCKTLPIFGFHRNGKQYLVSGFDVPFDDFVNGSLQGYLRWYPDTGDRLTVEVLSQRARCWRCHKIISVVRFITITDDKGSPIAGGVLDDSGIEQGVKNHGHETAQFLSRYLDIDKMNAQQEFKTGAIREREDPGLQKTYITNGCYYCDTVYGSRKDMYSSRGQQYASYRFRFNYDGKFGLPQHWYFKGRRL